jgi:hypothetical protein
VARKAGKKRANKGQIALETEQSSPGAPARIIVRGYRDNLPRDAAGKAVTKVEPDLKAAANPRQAILGAFGKLGGVRWLVKLARKYPKDFASLLAKAMPQDINVTGHLGYTAMPVPVEMREAIPGTCIDVTPTVTQVTQELDPFT